MCFVCYSNMEIEIMNIIRYTASILVNDLTFTCPHAGSQLCLVMEPTGHTFEVSWQSLGKALTDTSIVANNPIPVGVCDTIVNWPADPLKRFSHQQKSIAIVLYLCIRLTKNDITHIWIQQNWETITPSNTGNCFENIPTRVSILDLHKFVNKSHD